MRGTKNLRRGQVLIIFVFAIIGLVGIVGLAVDGGTIYSDRRQAQNAADTAALAAAMARNADEKQYGECNGTLDTAASVIPGCASNTVNTAIAMSSKNGYPNNGSSISVQVYSPPKHGTYSDCSQPTVFDCHDYVEVVIADTVETWFARVVGIAQLHNTVQAVALAKYRPQTAYYGGNTLIELGQKTSSCPSDFDVGGSGNQGGTVTLNGGGIFVNSQNPDCAYKQTSCSALVTLTNGATIAVSSPGGYRTCTPGVPPIGSTSSHYDFPPAHIFDVPSQCTGPAGTYSGTSPVVYNPGSYHDFPPQNGDAYMNSGVYCVDNLKTTKAITSAPGGVFIFIRATGQVDMSGQGNNGDPKILLSPLTSGTYAGFLIYGDWNSSSSLNGNTCTIAGGAGTEFSGMIFVPYCQMTLAGNSTNSGDKAQIVAGYMKLAGSLNLTFTYDSSKLPKNPEQSKTGLYR